MGMVFRSISFLSSSDKSLFSLRSAFLTLCTKINFFVGRKRRIARNSDEIQYQTLTASNG